MDNPSKEYFSLGFSRLNILTRSIYRPTSWLMACILFSAVARNFSFQKPCSAKWNAERNVCEKDAGHILTWQFSSHHSIDLFQVYSYHLVRLDLPKITRFNRTLVKTVPLKWISTSLFMLHKNCDVFPISSFRLFSIQFNKKVIFSYHHLVVASLGFPNSNMSIWKLCLFHSDASVVLFVISALFQWFYCMARDILCIITIASITSEVLLTLLLSILEWRRKGKKNIKYKVWSFNRFFVYFFFKFKIHHEFKSQIMTNQKNYKHIQFFKKKNCEKIKCVSISQADAF